MPGTPEGARKIAAHKLGLDVIEYDRLVEAGQKHCGICRRWKPRETFCRDRSRYDGLASLCRDCKSARQRTQYESIPPEQQKPRGPVRIPRRDGDSLQARSRINHDVQQGQRPNPNDLPCAACSHTGSDKRHEYHHHNGYAAEHHYDVIALCSTCHHEEH